MNEPLSTADLIQEVREYQKRIDERMEQQSKQRHNANNQLNETLGKFSLQALRQEDQIENIQRSMGQIAKTMESMGELLKDFEQIRIRLIGDPEMHSGGLIQEISELKTIVNTNTESIQSLKNSRMIATWTITVLACLAAIVGWLKNYGVLNFLQK